jgi:hypothetical protein
VRAFGAKAASATFGASPDAIEQFLHVVEKEHRR